MKRVRTEQIQYAVAQYLKRRQYVDTDGSLKGAKLFQSAEEMAASLTGEQTAQVQDQHCISITRRQSLAMKILNLRLPPTMLKHVDKENHTSKRRT